MRLQEQVLTVGSAGSRDSALTNHGHQQATRLGLHLKALELQLTHLYSSHLQRASKTAGLIREAQLPAKRDASSNRVVPEVTQLRILMEQDFGDLEGKKWTEMQAELQNKPGYAAVETKEAVGRRADTFLDEHLLPLLDKTTQSSNSTVVIVSHGIFLSTLWKRLLRRLPPKSISLSSDLQSTARPSLEHLGGWSNTGYLELHMTRAEAEKPISADAGQYQSSKPSILLPVSDDTIGKVKALQAATQVALGDDEISTYATCSAVKVDDATPAASAQPTTIRSLTSGLGTARGWTTTILTINGRDHLKGLKRTGGGVGSSRHDASQKGIESFFKRRKVG